MYIPSSPLTCPHCSGKEIVGNGVKKGQIFVDVPHDGKPTFVAIERHRYRCNTCRKTFQEEFEGIVPGHNYTHRLVAYIEQESLKKSFLAVAKEVGLSEGTIRLIFNEFLARLEANFKPKTPQTLCLDVITLIGKQRYIASNLRLGGIVGFMEDTSPKSVEKYLKNLQDKDKIIRVVMDINPSSIEVVKRLLPGVPVVINPGYIINTILRILENMRVGLRKGLNAKDLRLLAFDRQIIRKPANELTGKERESIRCWEKRFPKLAQAYWCKEDLRVLFEDYTKADMLRLFTVWQKNVLADGLHEFMPVIDSIFEWKDEILGWFDITFKQKGKHYPSITSMDDEINQRLKRGYTFELIKARILARRYAYRNDGVAICAIEWGVVKEYPVKQYLKSRNIV